MRKWTIVSAGAVVGVLLFVAIASAASSGGAESASTPRAGGDTRDAAAASDDGLQLLGIQMTEVDAGDPLRAEAPIEGGLDEAAAIAKAREILGPVYSGQAKRVTAKLVDFTDSQLERLPEAEIRPQGLRCWVVTFSGLKMKRHGRPEGQPGVVTEMNVVMDAVTGAEIEMFAYK